MLLRAAAAGALMAGLPLAGVLCYERQQAAHTAESLSYYEQLQEQYSHAYLYVLACDAVAGEELTAQMLQKREIQSQEDLSQAQQPDEQELVGKRLKVSLAKGAALNADLVYEGVAVTEDLRQVEVSELRWPQTLCEDEFIDIRIVFPDGEDYLVVGHKRVYRIIRDAEGEMQALQLRFSEEELLRYQAACVDMAAYQDTTLYALQYAGEYQPAAQVYYPVNPEVFRLLQWDPNIRDLFVVEAEQERRSVLEEHLEDFLNDQPERTSGNPSPEKETAKGTEESLTLYTGLPEET